MSMGLQAGANLKVVIQLVPAKRPYYMLRVYDEGRLLLQAKRVLKPEYVLKWVIYNQSLIEGDFMKIEKRKSGTVVISVSRAADRHFKLLLFHSLSVLNIRSSKKADCLAICWSSIDAISPVIDALWSLMMVVDTRRFSSLLRGYCLCR